MTVRNITLKKLDAKNQVQEIDDSLTCYYLLFHKAKSIAALIAALKDNEKLSIAKYAELADCEKAFNATHNNLHRLSKQIRAYQRSHNIRYSSDASLTHYVYLKRKIKVDTRNVKETSVCNILIVVHLYELQIALKDDMQRFNAIKKQIASLS